MIRRQQRYHVHRDRVVGEQLDDVVAVPLHLDARLDKTPCRHMDAPIRVDRIRLHSRHLLHLRGRLLDDVTRRTTTRTVSGSKIR